MRKKKFVGVRRVFFIKPASKLKEFFLCNTGGFAIVSGNGGLLSKESIEAAR